ncbi:MAG: hypothetical protein E7401_00470 [Ruminococcaceae bacterium]|nr:hypothetical protein [Oscillospiraceae bacterium]
MSFLNIRGEKIHCKKCGEVCTIEYEGGAKPTQIGDFSVIEQKRLSKKYMRNYDAKDKGYYYHHFGICSRCISRRHRATELYDKQIIDYIEKVKNFAETKEWHKSETLKKFESNINEDLLRQASPTSFCVLKDTKHFGIKKEKRRIVEKYIEQAKSEIAQYLNEQLEKIPELKQAKEELFKIEKKLTFILPKCKRVIKGYMPIDLVSERNLNPYICYEMTTRVPKEIDATRGFYKPIKYSKEMVESIIGNNEKLNCALNDDDLEYFWGKLFRVVLKLDF